MIEPYFFDHIMSTELLFTIIAVVFCFLIYFKTKESYDLTKYKGIKYFRDAFLFLGLSYVLRFLFSPVLLPRITFDLIPPMMFMPFFILPMGYFSTIGIFYIILSSTWKKFNNRNFLIFGHGAAIALSVVSFIMRSHLILLYLQCTLLVIVVMLSFVMPDKGKKISQIKLLYILVAILWLINLFDVDRPGLLPLEMLFKIISLVVFAVIYHKISKWVK